MKTSASGQFKPCPFCGSEKAKAEDMGKMLPVHYVKCAVCGAHTNWYSTPSAAQEAWNMRPRAKAPPAQKKKTPAGKSKPAQKRRKA